VPGGERDPQRFWVSVADALRNTVPGSALVRGLTAAPDLDGWAVVERLLKDLASLEDRVWLVIDDLHELRAAEALRQRELLVIRAPPELRFVLATRHDLRLGLHRLRLEGELTEIRAADLRFTAAIVGASSPRREKAGPTQGTRTIFLDGEPFVPPRLIAEVMFPYAKRSCDVPDQSCSPSRGQDASTAA
jgi:hypothetical protein